METVADEWFYHPTESTTVDVAVYPVSITKNWDHEFFSLKEEGFVNKATMTPATKPGLVTTSDNATT